MFSLNRRDETFSHSFLKKMKFHSMSVVGLSLSACIPCVVGLLLNYLTKNLLGYPLTCYQKIFDQIQIRNTNGKLKKY